MTFFKNLHDERLYRIWRAMFSRCYYPTHKAYKHYGGRGITICNDWHSFVNFVYWALTNGYSDELTIDRIDVNGNYEPSNCRWSTMAEQFINKRMFNPEYIYNNIYINLTQRNKKWQYRFKAPKINDKRKQISKCGFSSKEDALNAAKLKIDEIYGVQNF